jgi:hypothetical protein
LHEEAPTPLAAGADTTDRRFYVAHHGVGPPLDAANASGPDVSGNGAEYHGGSVLYRRLDGTLAPATTARPPAVANTARAPIRQSARLSAGAPRTERAPHNPRPQTTPRRVTERREEAERRGDPPPSSITLRAGRRWESIGR